MNDIIEFITSEEMAIVGCIILVGCILVSIVYILEKNWYKRKLKHNTKELNNLVSDIEEIKSIEETNIVEVNTPNNIEAIDSISAENNIKEVISTEQINKEISEEKPLVIPIEELEKENQENIIEEEKTTTVEQIYSDVKEEIENIEENKEELQYTDIEPNQEEAREELKKLTEDLIKKEQEELENKNIELTKFEEEQEENAIISIDELMKKGNELYEKNEVTQYEDEGNEPISLQDLELRMNNIKEEIEAIEIEETIEEINDNKTEVIEENTNKVVLDDFNTIDNKKNVYRDDIVFKSSPIISPIFGIEEKAISTNDMMLENTANYEKLDEEIKKTNEFLVTLKELQKKLD